MSDQKTDITRTTASGEVINPGDPAGIADSITPYFPEESKKMDYLRYRVAGFSRTEAVLLANVHLKTVHRWCREDAEFKKLDTDGMSVLRQNLSSKYMALSFTRNFMLFLQKDFDLLMKERLSTIEKSDGTSANALTEDEKKYLTKVRSLYSPQALAEIKALADNIFKNPLEKMNFTDLVFKMREERRELIIERKSDGQSI